MGVDAFGDEAIDSGGPGHATAPSVRNAKNKRFDIQGLRAIAVGWVVLFHAGIPGFRGGYVGVDVFFVISGFLISTHLLEGLERRGRVEFAKFYARRARRLLPAAFTVIVLTSGCALAWVSPVQLPYVFRDAIASLFYVPNILFAINATDYWADKTPSLFLHYWSLGVEEQFYLVWPLVLLILFRVIEKTNRTMVVVTAGITALSFGSCVWLTSYSQPFAFYGLPARVWEFGIGALLAIAQLNTTRPLSPIFAGITGWLGLACAIFSGVLFTPTIPYPGYAVAMPVIGTALVIAAGANGSGSGPTALLGIRPLVFLGDISYSLYLVHWPALVLPEAAHGYMQPLPLWGTALIAVLCVPAAWLLYRYVEQPGMHLRGLVNGRPRRTFAAALAAMIGISSVVMACGFAGAHAHLDAGKPAPPTQIKPDPAGTPYVPSNLKPSLRDALTDQPALYTNGCHLSRRSTDPRGCWIGDKSSAPRVVLFGDSHAAQWYPALSVLVGQGLIRLETHTKSACPSLRLPDTDYPECDTWARQVISRLAADPPDLILLANYVKGYPKGHSGNAYREALLTLSRQLPRKSQVAIIADTPSIGVTPSFCLGRFVNDANQCALRRNEALDDVLRNVEVSVAQEGITAYFDYADLFCNAVQCPAVMGDTLVYRDGSHITEHFSKLLAGSVMSDIQRMIMTRSSES